ncbi:unnamed protein product [Linum trigynum]|uniref:Uncharacterized protein n=1 Tax=Linum trigynum TaxID=586398 RepID=A0AAV2GL67_9ROSI
MEEPSLEEPAPNLDFEEVISGITPIPLTIPIEGRKFKKKKKKNEDDDGGTLYSPRKRKKKKKWKPDLDVRIDRRRKARAKEVTERERCAGGITSPRSARESGEAICPSVAKGEEAARSLAATKARQAESRTSAMGKIMPRLAATAVASNGGERQPRRRVRWSEKEELTAEEEASTAGGAMRKMKEEDGGSCVFKNPRPPDSD